VFFAPFAALALIAVVGCGKKGPPLPPLLKIPSAPAELTAERRASIVDLSFVVPSTNTDGTRPANIERVDVYAVTGAPTLNEEQILKLGTKVASVMIKAPRDPNATADPDEPDEAADAPEGKGLNQGVVARVVEELSDEALAPIKLDKNAKASKNSRQGRPRTDGPLLPPSLLPLSRTYVGVGISTRGRKGAMSKRMAVPLVPAPDAPPAPTPIYDEKAITVTWEAVADASTDDGVLPSTPLGVMRAPLAYNVYDGATKLTKTPVNEPTYADGRLAWGEKRCYVVRSVQKVDEATIESAASPEACVTPVDTFPPAVPKALQAVASIGAVTLIWEPNVERDLAGYIVLRGSSENDLEPMIQSPITATSYKDDLASGTRHVYAVRAVDKAGNVSAPSNRVEETAR
jgi:predicted small lipoprotein YifL